MNLQGLFEPTFAGIAILVGAMVFIAAVELVIPLHARGPEHRAHLKPNLVLTAVTVLASIFLNAALLALVLWMQSHGFGLLRWFSISAVPAAVLAVLALDLAFYAAHVSWHKIPALWRFHAVHHSDPALDVTTTIRQHPVNGLLAYATMAAVVLALGPSPGAFAVYRVASAVNALLEHGNFRAPRLLDRALSLVTSWPHMHKVHHSRIAAQTDSNYGNLFSFWDRLFGTYTPSWEGTTVSYGLDGFDDAAIRSAKGLLQLPFRDQSNARQDSG